MQLLASAVEFHLTFVARLMWFRSYLSHSLNAFFPSSPLFGLVEFKNNTPIDQAIAIDQKRNFLFLFPQTRKKIVVFSLRFSRPRYVVGRINMFEQTRLLFSFSLTRSPCRVKYPCIGWFIDLTLSWQFRINVFPSHLTDRSIVFLF